VLQLACHCRRFLFTQKYSSSGDARRSISKLFRLPPVVGTDYLQGGQRLWYWKLDGSAGFVKLVVPQKLVRGAMVVAHKLNEHWFWMLEEDDEGVYVSLWSCGDIHAIQLLSSTQLKDIRLLSGSLSMLNYDRREKRIIADQNSILVLGVNKQQQVILIRVEY
jgi:hypothetical protein